MCPDITSATKICL